MKFAIFPETADPRTIDGFDSNLLPLCDGGDFPAIGTAHLQERRMIEFAGIYYRLNCAILALGAGPAEEEQKQPLYAEISRLGSIRDQLEDRYAPEGYLAEPIMNGPYYSDIYFLWSGKPPLTHRTFRTVLSGEINL